MMTLIDIIGEVAKTHAILTQCTMGVVRHPKLSTVDGILEQWNKRPNNQAFLIFFQRYTDAGFIITSQPFDCAAQPLTQKEYDFVKQSQ